MILLLIVVLFVMFECKKLRGSHFNGIKPSPVKNTMNFKDAAYVFYILRFYYTIHT